MCSKQSIGRSLISVPEEISCRPEAKHDVRLPIPADGSRSHDRGQESKVMSERRSQCKDKAEKRADEIPETELPLVPLPRDVIDAKNHANPAENLKKSSGEATR